VNCLISYNHCRHIQNNQLIGTLDVLQDLPFQDLYAHSISGGSTGGAKWAMAPPQFSAAPNFQLSTSLPGLLPPRAEAFGPSSPRASTAPRLDLRRRRRTPASAPPLRGRRSPTPASAPPPRQRPPASALPPRGRAAGPRASALRPPPRPARPRRRPPRRRPPASAPPPRGRAAGPRAGALRPPPRPRAGVLRPPPRPRAGALRRSGLRPAPARPRRRPPPVASSAPRPGRLSH
jgi:hypothetical protein